MTTSAPLRRGGLLNLRRRDIDLDGATIHITGSAAFMGGRRVEGTTESGRSRVVGITAGYGQGSKGSPRASDRRETRNRGSLGTPPMITCSAPPRVAPLTPTRSPRWWPTWWKPTTPRRTGPPPAEPPPHTRLHDLRHIHARCSWRASPSTWWPPGPATPIRAVTLRVYAHVINEQLVEAVGIFAAAVGESVAW